MDLGACKSVIFEMRRNSPSVQWPWWLKEEENKDCEDPNLGTSDEELCLVYAKQILYNKVYRWNSWFVYSTWKHQPLEWLDMDTYQAASPHQ